jgi:tetratricopeptide (TPR) repeat protein
LRARAESWFDVGAKASAYLDIAQHYQQLKDYDRATEAVERAIEIDPDDFWGFFVRMRIHKELGDDAAAEADCETVAGMELDDPEDLSNRGRWLRRACDDPERAIEDFNHVIELAPKWHEGYYGRGSAYAVLKRYDEALVDLNKAIELAPHHPYGYNNRAVVLEELGRFEEALADKKKALEVNPYYALGWTNYGESLFSLGRLGEALAAHERAIELRPRLPNGYQNRAYTLAWLGRCDEAASAFRRAAELGPAKSDSMMAWAHLSHYYYTCPNHYDLSEALRHARSAYEADADRDWLVLAMALLREGNYAEAKRVFLEGYEKNPDNAWFGLSMCLWHLGEKSEAREFYDRSVVWLDERLPDHPVGLRRRQETAELLGIEP